MKTTFNRIRPALLAAIGLGAALSLRAQSSSVAPAAPDTNHPAAAANPSTAAAQREEKLFKRFKAEEASQALTARRRALRPEDNNERQPIHDHESAVK